MADQEEKKPESKKPFGKLLIILLLIGIGVACFLNFFEITNKNGQVTIRRRDAGDADLDPNKPNIPKINIKMPPLRKGRGDQIQIATFNAGPIDTTKLASKTTINHLANAIRNFDLVALQDLHIHDPGQLNQITKKLNDRGRHYDYVVSPGQVPGKGPFNAFLYDRASIEVDLDQTFTLTDPHGRLLAKPLAALFRVRGPTKDQAFTFVAINVYIAPNEREAELDLLPGILETVKQNYPNEDDWLLLASLQTAPSDFGALANLSNITHVVSNMPNMVGDETLADNILFDRRATIEYTGSSGVYGMFRDINLSTEKAREITRHLPVWATFNIYEGGRFIK